MRTEAAPSLTEPQFRIVTLEYRFRPWRIAFALLLVLAGLFYYATIDGSFRRPPSAAFTPPAFLASEVTRLNELDT